MLNDRCLKEYKQRLQYSNKVEERDIPTPSDTVTQNSHHVSEEQDARGVSESSGTLEEGEQLTCTENDPQNIPSSSVSEVLDKSGPENTSKHEEPKNESMESGNEDLNKAKNRNTEAPKNESMESGNVDLNKSKNRSTANTKDLTKNSENRITKRRKKMEARHSRTKRVNSKTTNSSLASSSGKSKHNRSHARKLQKSNFKTILPVKQPVIDEESIACDTMKTETVSKEETVVRTMDKEKNISEEEVKIRNPVVNQSTEQFDTREQLEEVEDPMAGWEFLSEQDNCTVYYKPHGCDGLYQYKVIGSYNDITARDFMDVQVLGNRNGM